MTKKTIFALFAALSCSLFSLNMFAQYTVDGFVLYHNKPNKPIPGAEVTLSQQGTIIQTAYANATGKYIFTNVPAGTYQINATTGLPAGGVTLQDSYLILLHLLNLYSFTPIQFLAADVDGDGQITWSDYFTVLTGWFLYGYPFPSGEWVFQEATVIAGMKDGNNLGGSSSADVNGSYSPNITKTERALAIENTGFIQASAHQNARLPIFIKNTSTLSGFVLYFEYPAESFEITGVQSHLKDLEFIISENELRIVWSDQAGEGISVHPDQPVFYINIITRDGIENTSAAGLIPSIGSHAIDHNGNPVADLKIGSPQLNYSQPSIETIQIYPNPVNTESVVQLQLSENAMVTFTLFNTEGRRIGTLLSKELPAGIHTLPLDGWIEGTQNLLYQCIITNNKGIRSLSGKILKAR
jgi:hypothetical protein